MVVRYDRKRLERTILFLTYDFITGSIRIQIDEEGNLHFFRDDLKLITIRNLTALEGELLEKNDKDLPAISSMQ